MKRWLNLDDHRPWDRPKKDYIRVTSYTKGSLENKIGMSVLWVYYVIFATMFFRGLVLFLTR